MTIPVYCGATAGISRACERLACRFEAYTNDMVMGGIPESIVHASCSIHGVSERMFG